MKKIFVDYDSTTVDFLNPFLAYINSVLSTNLTIENLDLPENKKIYDDFMNDFYKGKIKIDFEKIYNNITLFQGVMEFFNYLKNNGFEIVFVTSSMKGQKEPKVNHIQKYFNDYVSEIIHARKKFTYTGEGHFIDDSIKHIEEHCKNNKTLGILFNFNNMHSLNMVKVKELEETYCNFKFVSSFEDLINVFELLKQPTKQNRVKKELHNTITN